MVDPSFGRGLAVHVPWFLYDLTNNQLITTKYLPGDISDTKEIVFTETPIPGLNYRPIMPGGAGNRKLSFTIPLYYKTSIIGNVAILKQFDALRNRSSISILGKRGYQFDSNPKVLYFWGVGSVPLIYYVTKCDASHKQGWVNAWGQPQASEINMELMLDEADPIYKYEEMYRAVMGVLGMTQGVIG